MKDEIRCAVELRSDDTRQGPGRLVGRIMTYGELATDRPELFEPGALTWPGDGVVLNRQHERGAPIMRVIPALVGDELRIDQALPDTQAGRDAAVGDSVGSDAWLVRVISSAASSIRGRRAAYPVGRDDGDRISRFTELRRAC